jgi:hypothetical protein
VRFGYVDPPARVPLSCEREKEGKGKASLSGLPRSYHPLGIPKEVTVSTFCAVFRDGRRMMLGTHFIFVGRRSLEAYLCFAVLPASVGGEVRAWIKVEHEWPMNMSMIDR